VCSIAANSVADGHLSDLRSSGDDKRIEKKLKNFAGDSSVEKSGYLDAPDHHLRRIPAELQDMRRIRSGRHRVFYSGHHTQCSYLIIFIKQYKKTGTQDEDDPRFQRLLALALQDTGIKRVIREADETNKSS
jgi:hypothetical protein